MSAHLLPLSEPKMTHELAIPVEHHTFGNAMEPHDLLEVEVSNLCGMMSGLA